MNRRELIRRAGAALGCSLSNSLLQAAWGATFTELKPSRDLFPGDTRDMVKLLAELIIPQTDTPGAIEAGVPRFIELMVTEWYTEAERQTFFAGLDALNEYCMEDHYQSFVNCTAAQQAMALTQTEHAAQAAHARDEGAPFFAQIKELTVLGYYTSELGATRELRYNPVPGHYDGNYPFAKVGTNWSS